MGLGQLGGGGRDGAEVVGAGLRSFISAGGNRPSGLEMQGFIFALTITLTSSNF